MTKKILIADDEPNIVAALEFLLQRSGYEVCQRMRERAAWRHIKIIMLSAKGREAEVNKGLSLGANLYVTKPWSNKDLIAKIEQLLESAPNPGGT